MGRGLRRYVDCRFRPRRATWISRTSRSWRTGRGIIAIWRSSSRHGSRAWLPARPRRSNCRWSSTEQGQGCPGPGLHGRMDQSPARLGPHRPLRPRRPPCPSRLGNPPRPADLRRQRHCIFEPDRLEFCVCELVEVMQSPSPMRSLDVTRRSAPGAGPDCRLCSEIELCRKCRIKVPGTPETQYGIVIGSGILPSVWAPDQGRLRQIQSVRRHR